MKLFPLIVSGNFTENINGENMTAGMCVVVGLYSSNELAQSALSELETIQYPEGWGASAAFVCNPVEVDTKPQF